MRYGTTPFLGASKHWVGDGGGSGDRAAPGALRSGVARRSLQHRRGALGIRNRAAELGGEEETEGAHAAELAPVAVNGGGICTDAAQTLDGSLMIHL